MESVLRAAVIYGFLLTVFRISGKRSLAQITPFDFVLLLIVAEATQQALLGPDYSITNAALVILTIVGIDIALSHWRLRSRRVEKLLDDVPLVLVDRGVPIADRLARSRVHESDILEAARLRQGLTTLEEIEYAVLETNGEISIVPRRGAGQPAG
jgi:uncharacterized membrane protein YcaP (DUF421 family)